jgi:hypothetical protein
MIGRFKFGFILAGTVLALGAAAPAGAVSFVGLFNTGVDDSGNILTPGVADTHYKIVASDNPVLGLPLLAPYPTNPVSPTATAYATFKSDSWNPNGNGSSWISPFVKSVADGGEVLPSTAFDTNPYTPRYYDYVLTFNLGTVSIDDAFMQGQVQSDNAVSIFLNDAELVGQGQPDTGAPNTPYFQSFSAFGTTNGFQAGDNTLRFRVTDYGVVTGLRVGSLISSAIPEPGVWAMMIVGFGLVAGQIRRRRRNGNFAIA